MSLSTTIYKLRTNSNLSQAEFAELFGVSQQSVQKWESGVVTPDLNKLINISAHFGISLDALVSDDEKRLSDIIGCTPKFYPEYSGVPQWESFSAEIMTEYTQATEEGLNISSYKKLFEGVSAMPAGINKEKISDVLFDIISAAGIRPDFEYNEPSTLEEIKALRKPYEFKKSNPERSVLENKIHGALLGRICGCTLGKPLEGVGHKEMIPLLKALNNYPLSRYISYKDLSEEIHKKYLYKQPNCFFPDYNGFAPEDDDTNYVVIAQTLIDTYGRDFTPFDVSRIWLSYQTKDKYCTAERVAYCNFINGFVPPVSAMYKNPFREWIGAQIRGDYFGYINPGNPEAAAEMAWRDASISHTKNGIYGEMFISAVIAAAAVSDSITDIIEAGLAQIPYTSRLYAEIRSALSLYKDGARKEDIYQKIYDKYDEYRENNWCHVIPNAMLVTIALLYGNGDYSKSICMAVECCFDTDCNAATVGSILGMLGGRNSIPRHWTEPLNDTLATSLIGKNHVKISEMAQKTMEHIKL